MSNAKHTAGPWSLHPFSNEIPFEVIDDSGRAWMAFDLCIGSGEKRVATAHMQSISAGYPAVDNEQECRANAALIAAAPELLEACQTFAEWLRREDTGFVKAGNERDTPEGEAKWREWFNENLRVCDLAQTQAIAAIASATGASHE